MSETLRIQGDGEHMRDVLAWLVHNCGPMLQQSDDKRWHPLGPLLGQCWSMQRVPYDPMMHGRLRPGRFIYEVTIHDDQLLVMFKLRWL